MKSATCLLLVVAGANGILAAEPTKPAKPNPAWVKEAVRKVRPIVRDPAEPVRLKQASSAADVDGRSFDVVVIGGTAGGVAAAVRAAREGCSVLLVQHDGHLGGMITNGLGQWDALYGGHRSALFTELLTNIEGYYAGKYGEDSYDFRAAHYSHDHYPIGWCEPHVFEREMNRLAAGEKRLTLLYDHHPQQVERDGPLLRNVTLVEHRGAKTIRVAAKSFIDAGYEGDLAALARVPYRVGREARAEYDEPHAGKCFTTIAKGPAPTDAVEGRLNIRPYGNSQGPIDPTSPYSADGAVQAYNMRFCVTRDPANRLLLTEPPPGYDRNEFLHYERRYIAATAGPNQKSHMNSPILPGENHAYPEASWPERDRITARHTTFALGLMWFLQNDETIPAADRKKHREWGLPRDEFADNDHIPYEMYVRETRRIVGRHVFTERDGSLAPGLCRSPVFTDSIAVTDWYMDSHSCTTDTRPNFKYDGKLILTEESRPSQIPYRALLPQGVDNLLVPVCLSATHIAWGAVRLEPVFMQTGEAAGYAAALAVTDDVPPARLSSDKLIHKLVDNRQYVSFFNDSNAADEHPATAAAQYFGTKGFFADYDARLDAPLTEAVGRVWQEAFEKLRNGTFKHADEPMATARAVAAAERTKSPNPTAPPLTRGAALLKFQSALRPK